MRQNAPSLFCAKVYSLSLVEEVNIRLQQCETANKVKVMVLFSTKFSLCLSPHRFALPSYSGGRVMLSIWKSKPVFETVFSIYGISAL